MTTRSGKAFGQPGGYGGDGGGGNRGRKRDREEPAYEYASESDSDSEEEEEDDQDADAEGEDDVAEPEANLPKRKAGEPQAKRPRKGRKGGGTVVYDTPSSYASREDWVQAHAALGAPRGCVDGVPEDYAAYMKRKEKYRNWLKSLLFVRNAARKAKTPNAKWLTAPKTKKITPDSVNPNRHEAENNTDPRSWPKQPGDQGETFKESKTRISMYNMWVHEPGNYTGPWPPGIHPCEDPNEPDPPHFRGMAPSKPCTNCTDNDPVLRCSPWRGIEIGPDDTTRFVKGSNARCENCKKRGLKDCHIAPGLAVAANNRKFKEMRRNRRKQALEQGATTEGTVGAPAPVLEGDARPPPPEGFVYRYKDGRRGLMPAPTKKQISQAMPAISQFSCQRCIERNLVCSIVAPPKTNSRVSGRVALPKEVCLECRKAGTECGTSDAWNMAVEAEVRRRIKEHQKLNEQQQLRESEAQRVGFGSRGYNDPGFGNPGFGNPGFNPSFGTQGLMNQGFGNQGFNNQGFGNQGFGNQGFGNQGFGNQGFGNQGFGNQGFGNQGFGSQSLVDQALADQAAQANQGLTGYGDPTWPNPPMQFDASLLQTESIPEGLQCEPCKNEGRGDICNINTPCNACILKGLTFEQCRPFNPDFDLPLDLNMGMDLDFGIGMDFTQPIGQEFPQIVEPPVLENPPNRNFFGAMNTVGMQRPPVDPNMDSGLQLAGAWAGVANIAQQRGIFVPPNSLPRNPPPLTAAEMRQVVLDEEYQGDLELMMMEEQMGRRIAPVVPGWQAQQDQPDRSLLDDLLDRGDQQQGVDQRAADQMGAQGQTDVDENDLTMAGALGGFLGQDTGPDNADTDMGGT